MRRISLPKACPLPCPFQDEGQAAYETFSRYARVHFVRVYRPLGPCLWATRLTPLVRANFQTSVEGQGSAVGTRLLVAPLGQGERHPSLWWPCGPSGFGWQVRGPHSVFFLQPAPQQATLAWQLLQRGWPTRFSVTSGACQHVRPKDGLAKLNLASDLPPDHKHGDVCPGVAVPGWNGAPGEVARPRQRIAEGVQLLLLPHCHPSLCNLLPTAQRPFIKRQTHGLTAPDRHANFFTVWGPNTHGSSGLGCWYIQGSGEGVWITLFSTQFCFLLSVMAHYLSHSVDILFHNIDVRMILAASDNIQLLLLLLSHFSCVRLCVTP